MKSTNIFSRFLPGHAYRMHRDSITPISTRTDSLPAYQRWDNTLPMTDAAWLKRRGEVPQMDRRAYRGHKPLAAAGAAVTRDERIMLADLESAALQASFFNTVKPFAETEPVSTPVFKSEGGGDSSIDDAEKFIRADLKASAERWNEANFGEGASK